MIELIQEYLNRYQVWTLWDDISHNISDYKELLKALRDSQKGDIIDIDIECQGGDCNVGFKIIQHIKEAEATIHMIVSGECYSMGSLIAIAGDSVEMLENTYLMFHTYSTAVGKMKSGDLTEYINHSHKRAIALDNKYSKPFLTDVEVQRMHEGKDVYIWADDKSLPARIKRHFKPKNAPKA